MKNVNDFLFTNDTNDSDYSTILDREQKILDVMVGQIKVNVIKQSNDSDEAEQNLTILEIHGIEITNVNDSELKTIKDNLRSVNSKFKNAWKVVNIKTQKRYDAFVEKEKIKNTKLLWHGTRNENVFSILSSGLLLRPNAVITGAMFGAAIYSAKKATKSLGYTSLSVSYWANGREATGFMLLFDTALGNSHKVYSFKSEYQTLDYNKLQKFSKNNDIIHSLHACSSKGMLRNDELMVYKEEQMTVKYLVELSN